MLNLETFLCAKLPVYAASPSQVAIISEPSEFYETLLSIAGDSTFAHVCYTFRHEVDNLSQATRASPECVPPCVSLQYQIRHAQHRIVLSTLYIGQGELEVKLVEALREAVCDRHVTATILMDASRGSRPAQVTQRHAGCLGASEGAQPAASSSSCCLLAEALCHLPGVRVLLYQEPGLRHWWHRLLPPRVNEVLGVQHIKVYVFDDNLVLTGANLSSEYFTTRQDRAWLFAGHPGLAGFYAGLVDVLAPFCYALDSNAGLHASSPDCDPLKAPLDDYRLQFRSAIVNYLNTAHARHPDSLALRQSTATPQNSIFLIPLVQCGAYDIRYEEKLVNRLFSSLKASSSLAAQPLSVALISGYFNLTHDYEHLLVDLLQCRPNTELSMLCASPEANGFLKSRGLTGYIPSIYREFLIGLLTRLTKMTSGLKCPPSVLEYVRSDWTFHSKGIWIEEPPFPPVHQQCSAMVTLIGSSNFNYRSLNRDLESEVVVYTRDETFQKRMVREKQYLISSPHNRTVSLSSVMAQTHFRLPWYMRILLPILHTYM